MGEWVSAVKQRRQTVVRSVLEDEIAKLDQVTVNDQVSDLMRDSAPDTYEIIRDYLVRRLNHL